MSWTLQGTTEAGSEGSKLGLKLANELVKHDYTEAGCQEAEEIDKYVDMTDEAKNHHNHNPLAMIEGAIGLHGLRKVEQKQLTRLSEEQVKTNTAELHTLEHEKKGAEKDTAKE